MMRTKVTTQLGKYALGSIIGGIVGGSIGGKVSGSWSKSEKELLKTLTREFMARLKRQPRSYSLFVQIDQQVRNLAALPDGEDKKAVKKTILTLTQSFLTGLTDKDKKLYLRIQQLTDKVYKIESKSIGVGVTLGGVIGLVIAGNL